ncbi:MAG TPA: anaerobic ribonucleoside-triphosphate reductase activating protein [Casimicrobiaceae bacterium]|nr:anaerobic ribonucleoside-triphosphate reductase activating protein [Casimicrobiaceae bacterium]
MTRAPPAERATPAARSRRIRGELSVGGLTPLSSTDWPGELCAVVFCQGCPWRCGYCHNPALLPARRDGGIAWADIEAFLARRRGLLDGVVFSGGEPLAQPGLAAAMASARAQGFRVGLHTGGAYPRRFAQVLPLLDWVGFDIKAPFDEYPLVTAVPGSGDQALASARLLIESGVDCEFRTTVHPRQLSPAAIERLAAGLAGLGARRYVLQAFRSTGCVNARFIRDVPASSLDGAWVARLARRFESFDVRAA